MPRVLLTNDDGPPGSKSRYIEPFYRELRARGFEVHVCVPSGHRSWASKALNPWQEVRVTETDIAGDGNKWWLCEEGMPAAAANIGLFHITQMGPKYYDAVLSGPNFGRNTASAFVLSSGTLAGALEGALAGVKSIALSFDNDMKEATQGDSGAGNDEMVSIACEATIDIVESLLKSWPADVELFNINVPLNGCRKRCSSCIETRVQYNSLFDLNVTPESRSYKFTCSNVTRRCGNMCKSQSKGLPSDTEVLNRGEISITALKACFDVACAESGGQHKYTIPAILAPFVLGVSAGVLLTLLYRGGRK